VSRGSTPDHVKVTFAVGGHSRRFDLTARAGLPGAAGLERRTGRNRPGALDRAQRGAVSDGDSLLERFAGMTVRVEDQKAGSDRVRLAFEFDSYHEMWNGATVAAPADLYRARAELRATGHGRTMRR